MNNLNTAIKRAIKSGWRPSNDDFVEPWEVKGSSFNFAIEKTMHGQRMQTMSTYEILLDPQFWQCLGVAMGWEKPLMYHDGKGDYRW